MATRNRYAELMAQYQQAQPFSFFGYPSTYSGGYDVTPYQPYRPYSAPVNLYEDIMAQPMFMGGDRRAIDWNPEWTNLSDEGKAAFYAENPGWARLTQAGQTLFGLTGIGMLQGRTDPDFVARQKLIAQGINPATMDYSNEGRNYPAPTGGFVSAVPTQADTSNYSNEGRNYSLPTGGRPYGTGPVPPNISENDFYATEAALAQPAETQSLLSRYPAPISAEAQARASLAAQISKEAAEAAADRPGGGGGGGGGMVMGAGAFPGGSGAPPSGVGGGGYGRGVATGGNNGDASGGGDRGTRGGFAKGGHVSMMHLGGPDPDGPDDGYASLKDGEYVINDKAVKKYGIELMNAINSGKISKGKLRGLLEM